MKAAEYAIIIARSNESQLIALHVLFSIITSTYMIREDVKDKRLARPVVVPIKVDLTYDEKKIYALLKSEISPAIFIPLILNHTSLYPWEGNVLVSLLSVQEY